MTENTNLSRRTLAKGAAWAVPAVAVAAAAPAMAKSGVDPVEPSYEPGTFCKHPGGGNQKYYHARFCFKNTSTEPITVTFKTFTINGVPSGVAQPQTLTIPAGQSCCVSVDGYPFGNSANGQGLLAFEYTYNGQLYQRTIGTTPGINDIPVCSNVGQPHDYSSGNQHINKVCTNN